MSQKYADIIIDISHEGVDRSFEYKIPEELEDSVAIGCPVKVPFGAGDKIRTGYVVGIHTEPKWDVSKLKSIALLPEKSLPVEAKLVELADWIRKTYGCTMISALKTVMPVKEKVKARKESAQDFGELAVAESLSEEQQQALDTFCTDYDGGVRDTYLLHGITGSGKTEVYIRMAEKVIETGAAVIVLIPEISLTVQTVARFRAVFKDRISILNSRLSKGEKYTEFQRAKKRDTDIIIGPRSALFAPFENLGLIIIDEEHDTSYKSEQTPKYHARETAIERARIEGASVVLGSATPSISSYHKAEKGEYRLLKLTSRPGGLPAEVSVVDMRDELKKGNRSIISEELYNRLDACFKAGEQAMLFINRRGFNTFVSCRECGEVIKCPRCDVSLSLHGGKRLMCHYCGHTEVMPDKCPKCSSPLIGGYGTGTEKVEAEVKRLFPGVRTLRMDKDTTKGKDDHAKIINSFRQQKADCLIGTQMIVKGHDFGNVTVAGAILADLGLFDNDYEASERTFDLLTQAAGRAGRSDKKGYVVIQTYQPEHYAIICAAKQSYMDFYQYEMAYRRLLRFPPVYELLGVLVTSKNERLTDLTARAVAIALKEVEDTDVIGPSEAFIYRIDEVFRRVIYVKAESRETFVKAVAHVQERIDIREDIDIQFDFDPMRIQ